MFVLCVLRAQYKNMYDYIFLTQRHQNYETTYGTYMELCGKQKSVKKQSMFHILDSLN